MLLRVVVFSALLAVCHSFLLPNFYLARRKVSPDAGSTPTIKSAAASGFGAMPAKITQKLDHFATNAATWQQRYFFNIQFAPKPPNVAFLNLGGRAPETITRVSNTELPWMKWAQQYRAAVFNLEHRFYGESQPTSNQSVASLQYLTSRQALADAVEFINQMNQQYNMTNTRWIVFGGSYGGMLALWLRQEYPNIVNGAVGSSAPLQVTADFYQYMTVVEEALGNNATENGGSAECVSNVKIAFNSLIFNMNTPDGRDIISQAFNLTPAFSQFENSISYNDIQFFYYNMLQNFQESVLYSGVNWGPYATGYGVKQICDKMSATTTDKPLEGLILVNRYMKTIGMNETNYVGTFNNFTETIEYLQVEDFTAPDIPNFDSTERTWLWQTCTEFGFYPTTDVNEKTVFGAINPLSLYVEMCMKVFGDSFTASSIAAAVEATNSYYGGANGYRGTNVVIPNGSQDPYHVLGKYTSSDPSVVTYLSTGTTHMADMAPDANNTELNIVHTIIQINLDKWINYPLRNDSLPVTNTSVLGFEQTSIRTKRSILSPIPFKFSQAAQTRPEKASAFKKYHFGRPPGGLSPAIAPGTLSGSAFTSTFMQNVNHFSNTNFEQFNQTYWKNEMWKKPNGPQFLMIGGESEADPAWISNPNYTWLTYAQAQGATVYLLEHRYYGNSRIGSVTETPKYLSSRQALYDVKNFIETANVVFGYSQPWVVFGGSYAGALALWARQLFPNLISGAVGSSAPLQAKLDFFEYLEVAQNAILSSGSPECLNNITAGFTEMHQLLLSGTTGIQKLNDLFKLNPPFLVNGNITEQSKQYFFSNVYGNFQVSVQYSGDNKNGFNNDTTAHGIPFMCKIMQNGTQDPIENVAYFNREMNRFHENDNTLNDTENDYEGFVSHLKSGGQSNEDAAMKYWTYQTCTEFGYFQSTDSNSIFGSPTPVNFFVQMCKDVFPDLFPANGLSAGEIIMKSVDDTNEFYGGKKHYKGTNVIIPNGSNDPWSALGRDNSSMYSMWIPGVAHCADMYPARDSDPQVLKNARTTIGQSVAAFSTGAPQPTIPDINNIPTTTPRSNSNQTTAPKSVRSEFVILPIVITLLLL